MLNCRYTLNARVYIFIHNDRILKKSETKKYYDLTRDTRNVSHYDFLLHFMILREKNSTHSTDFLLCSILI